MKLPNMNRPCSDCPFRKDSTKGWLGEGRIKEILDAGSFTCHKTNRNMQCAGHMLLKEDNNEFVRLANKLGAKLTYQNLSGRELIFDTEKDCIKHHKGES